MSNSANNTDLTKQFPELQAFLDGIYSELFRRERCVRMYIGNMNPGTLRLLWNEYCYADERFGGICNTAEEVADKVTPNDLDEVGRWICFHYNHDCTWAGVKEFPNLDKLLRCDFSTPEGVLEAFTLAASACYT